MKTIEFIFNKITLIFVMVLLSFTACEESIEIEVIDKELVNEILKMENNVSGVISFNMLNSNEKAYLFQKKITDFMRSNALSKNQIAILEELLSAIKPENYLPENKNYLEPFMEKLEKEWTTKALLLFEKEIVYKLAFQIVNEERQSVINLKSSNCKCKKSSSAACLFGAWGDCGGTCNWLGRGCGWLGFGECDGLCGVYVEELPE